MGETPSTADENLFLLEGLESFYRHALKIIHQSQRHLYILSSNLDFPLYNCAEVMDAISTLARRDRHASIQILVKESRPLVERNHRLLHLARRLPSKINIRKLTIEPEDNDRAYLIGDKQLLLYKRDDREYSGFSNYRAGPEIVSILEDFHHLRQLHSVEDSNLRQLTL